MVASSAFRTRVSASAGWLLIALAVGWGLFRIVQAEPPLGSLHGMLIARDSGRPVPHAGVSLSGAYARAGTKSDDKGWFRFDQLPAGYYRLTASSAGHVLREESVAVPEGPSSPRYFEMTRAASWVQLVVHYDVIYPGEPVSVAISGLTLDPSYRLDIYRVAHWRYVNRWEAIEYPKALARAVELGEVTPVSSTVFQPKKVDWEGMFYDRPHVGALPTGQYLLVATGETGARSAAGITISRLALLVKSDHEQSVGYVTDLKSGLPVAGAQFSARSMYAVTDTDGLARLDTGSIPGGNLTYTARQGDDIVTLDLNKYSDGRGRYRLYTFTDRPIYRPGDRVRFKGVLRRQDGATYQLPGAVEVKVTVTDTEGTQVSQMKLTTNEQGSFAGTFDVPKLGRTGLYGLHIEAAGLEEYEYVSIASYLKPELQLTARPERLQFNRGETAAVTVQAMYYFGAPAPSVDLHWMLQRELYYPDSEFGFEGEYEGDYYGGEFVTEGDATTGDDGSVRISLPARLPRGQRGEEQSPYWDYRYRLNVWGTSEAGGSAEASTSYLMTRGDCYLEVQPDRYVLRPNTPAKVTVSARDFEGDGVSKQRISLSLIYEKRPERRHGKVQRQVVKSWRLTTGADGTVTAQVTATKQGEFVLEAVTEDSKGRRIAARRSVWAAGGDEQWYFGEGQAELTIISDRRQYGERDHVKLLVTTEQEGPGVFTVEGDQLWEVRPVQLRRGANLIEFELRPEFVPNAFVWVGQVYGKALHQAEKEIPISREARRLKVAITPGKPSYRPGEKATCSVTVTDIKGRPAQAELSLGVVDEAIYALAEDDTEDPADFFYRHRWNSVRTDFAPTGRYLGGGDKAPTEIDIRRKFVDTAYWAPQVMTDMNGRATASFILSDNLTSWRITARAVSADTRAGQAHVNFEVNKPLMVRLDLPRFATQGDRFRVSAYVHNETGQEQRVALDTWVRGLKLEARKETVTVRPHRVVRRDWWATVTTGKPAVIGASAIAGKLNDGIELTLPVNPFTKTQFDNWSGQTESSARVSFAVRDDTALDRNQLTIAVSPSIAASLFSSLQYLVNYPYGCVEQTVSQFLPDLYVLQLLQARGLGDTEFARRIPKMVTEGVARLSTLRRDEGGWGWGRWGELDIWMTSYALLALQEAQTAGYQVGDRQAALSMLENALRASGVEQSADGLATAYEWYEYPDDLAFATYVLARYQSAMALPTLTRALSDRKLSGRGRALCALAYFELGNESEAHKLVAEMWRTAKHEGKWRYWTGLQDEGCRWWDGGMNVEATAWSLKAGLRADPKDPRATAVAGWLLQERRGDHWVSTRDTAIALMALVDYLRGVHEPNPDYTAVVKVNGKELLRHTFTRDPRTWREVSVAVPASALGKGANTLNFTRVGTGGRLYYRANLRQQVIIREGERTARGEIFQITRDYYRLGKTTAGGRTAFGAAAKPGTKFTVGERVLVRLTITSQQRLRYALLEDPLPAGLEPNARGDVGFMDWRSWWVDNDVRDDKVSFYVDWLPATSKPEQARVIEYVVSAKTPGRFNALPPSGFAMYQPEVNALGEVRVIEVKE